MSSSVCATSPSVCHDGQHSSARPAPRPLALKELHSSNASSGRHRLGAPLLQPQHLVRSSSTGCAPAPHERSYQNSPPAAGHVTATAPAPGTSHCRPAAAAPCPLSLMHSCTVPSLRRHAAVTPPSLRRHSAVTAAPGPTVPGPGGAASRGPVSTAGHRPNAAASRPAPGPGCCHNDFIHRSPSADTRPRLRHASGHETKS